MRSERFAPIAERARAVWPQLRLRSKVNFGAVVLERSRRSSPHHTAGDGRPHTGGSARHHEPEERHSVALSLFLPRATLSESPFLFIRVDDLVQSMDPSRVKGLASALAEAAQTTGHRFTHDDRLPEAVRHLGLPANVHSVTRRAAEPD